jgi:anthranilate synthase component 2
MDVLVIDNYDSFTFNLVHYLKSLGARVTVWRNDEFELDDVGRFHKILLSPGPGLPRDAGLLLPLIRRYAGEKSILGVCLGQQAIAEAFGGSLVNLAQVYHGVATDIMVVSPDLIYDGLPDVVRVGRYHSWAVGRPLPDFLVATAIDADGQVMSLRHVSFDVRGVQFHPESVLTPSGLAMLRNWLAN